MELIIKEFAAESGIMLVKLNNPKSLNAIDPELMSALHNAVSESIADDFVKGIIITGAGNRAFAAGADISAFLGKKAGEASTMSKQGHDTFAMIETSPKPIIAAINGYALGGGLELALACHLRVASERVKVGLPEATLGLVTGFGGATRLFEIIGPTRAVEMLLTAEMIDADTAKDWGLVNKVCAAEREVSTARAMLETILKNGPLALGNAIAIVNKARQDRKASFEKEIETFGALFETKDAQEGISAFLEKRKAEFKGE